MTRVKICGLTREEDVDTAVDAGADAVGFILGFPNSPRNLQVSRAASLISRVPPFVTSVLVATADALAEHSDAIRRFSPRAIQLYGSSVPPSIASSFHAFLVRPFPVSRQESGDGSDVLSKAKEAATGYDALLIDTYRRGYDGGTGQTSDWNACASIRKAIAPTPLILSGGLRPENVELAIATVAPFCVDASSGVESAPGVKDRAKVRAFVANAYTARQSRVVQ